MCAIQEPATVMMMRLAAALLIALVAMSAHAQSTSDRSDVLTSKDTQVLPVWNNHSGKVEALLLLQPAQQPNGSMLFGAGASLNTGHGFLQTSVSADAGSSLALLCNSNTGLVTLGSLAGRCLVTSLNTSPNPTDPFSHSNDAVQNQVLRAAASFERPESLFEVSVGQANLNTGSLDWLSPATGIPPSLSILDGRLNQQDVTARGKMNLGDNGWVSIGGTLAHAQLIPTAGQGGADIQRWNSTSLGVAVGHGKISGEVVGSVVDVPGQSNSLNSLGVGLSWLTPWKGKVTFGAQKSTGSSALTPAAKSTLQDDGTVPYVQYHQDL
jgi:hypothetical protein